MSQYWAGYSATALALNPQEFEQFIQTYAAFHQINEDCLWENIDENGIREYEFIKSKATPDAKHKTFHITDVLTDENDGMELTPFYVNQTDYENRKLNQTQFDKNGKILACQYTKEMRGTDCYIITTDNQPYDITMFEKKPYETYNEMVEECKAKMQHYLPDDFDWHAHIGIFSYAAYA